MGPVQKRLAVTGDRRWMPVAGDLWQASAPTPFERLRVGPETTFGGPQYAPNPQGKGHLPGDGRPLARGGSPLPNVEDPAALWTNPAAPATPAGFFPLSPEHPERAAKFGTVGDAWFRDVYPADPPDTDPTFYNAAPGDQQLGGWLHGDEAFSLINMHPDQPLLSGRLPGYICRGFVSLKSGEWREVVMMPETVWLLPELGMGAVIHRGVTEIGTLLANDVDTLLLAYELRGGQHREPGAYQAAMARRLDDETAQENALRQDDLSPPEGVDDAAPPEAGQAEDGALEAGGESLEDPAWKPGGGKIPGFAVAALAGAQEQAMAGLAGMRQTAAELGLDLDALISARQEQDAAKEDHAVKDIFGSMGLPSPAPEARSPEQRLAQVLDLPGDPLEIPGAPQVRSIADVGAAVAYGKAMQAKVKAAEPQVRALVDQKRAGAEQQADQLKDKMRAAAAEIGLDYDARVAEVEAANATLPDPLSIAPALSAGAAALGETEMAAPIAQAGLEVEGKRAEITQAMSLAGGGAGGAPDFGGLDHETRKMLVQGAHHAPPSVVPGSAEAAAAGARAVEAAGAGESLNGSDLSGAALGGADLAGADLSGAVLANTALQGVALKGANLAGANLGKAKASGADLSGADLTGAVLEGADLSGATLAGVTIKSDPVREAKLGGADLSGAILKDTVFLECDFTGAKLQGAQVEACVFIRCLLAEADLSRAKLEQVSLVECDLAEASLAGASARRICITPGSDLSGANLTGADLREANLRGVKMSGAVLEGARLDSADLSEAVLDMARLDRARAVGAKFLYADLSQASMQGADLMNASLLGAALTGADLRGAHLFETETHYAVAEGADLAGARLVRCTLDTRPRGGGVA